MNSYVPLLIKLHIFLHAHAVHLLEHGIKFRPEIGVGKDDDAGINRENKPHDKACTGNAQSHNAQDGHGFAETPGQHGKDNAERTEGDAEKSGAAAKE